MTKQPPPPFFVLVGHEGNISALNFVYETDDILRVSPTLLSGSEIGEIFIWNLETFRVLFKLCSPEKTTILFLGYQKLTLFSQNKDGALNCWNFINQTWVITRKLMSESVGFCSSSLWLADNYVYISLYNQDKHKFYIYDADKKEETNVLSMKSNAGLCMCAKVIKIKDQWYVLAGYENGDVGFFSCEKNCQLSSMNFQKEVVTCLDFDSQYKMRGISGSPNDILSIWKVTDSFQFENVLQLKLPNPGVNAVKIRNDGKIVITAGFDFNIRVFSWKTLKPLAILNFHEQSVQCLTFSSTLVDKKNSVFASGSKDKNIALWSIY